MDNGRIIVRAGEIKDYCTSEFYEALSMWQITKVLGNPNGAVGWANEPIEFVEAFMALESEDNAVSVEEMGKHGKNHGGSSSSPSEKPIKGKGKRR